MKAKHPATPARKGTLVNAPAPIGDDLRAELLPNERVLWTGQPETSVLFTPMDIFLVPFSLFWAGFMVSFAVAAATHGFDPSAVPVIILFLFFGFYFVIGRFVYKNYRKRRTTYVVTDRRVISLVKTWRGVNSQAAFINTIPTIAKSMRKSGIGTLRFGNAGWLSTMYANTGMEWMNFFGGTEVPTFYDIKDADRVLELVNRQRQ